MLARSGAIPVEAEQLPGILGVRRVQRGRLPGAAVDLYFHRAQWCSIVQDESQNTMRARGAGDPGNHRLDPHSGDFCFIELDFTADFFPAHGPVPARLEVAHEAVLLDVDSSQPLHIGDTIPSRHDQTSWSAVAGIQRFSVQFIRNDRIARGGFLQRHAASELRIQGDRLPAECCGFFSPVGP